MILTSKCEIPRTEVKPQTNAKNAYVCARLRFPRVGVRESPAAAGREIDRSPPRFPGNSGAHWQIFMPSTGHCGRAARPMAASVLAHFVENRAW